MGCCGKKAKDEHSRRPPRDENRRQNHSIGDDPLSPRLSAAGRAGLVASRPLVLQFLHWLVDPQSSRSVRPLEIGNPAGFLQAVRRHRLAIPLARHAEALSLPASLAGQLVWEARHQQRASLALIALALEALPALEQKGLRALVLKGPALAMQTTGLARGRGGGDLDLSEAVVRLTLERHPRPVRWMCGWAATRARIWATCWRTTTPPRSRNSPASSSTMIWSPC